MQRPHKGEIVNSDISLVPGKVTQESIQESIVLLFNHFDDINGQKSEPKVLLQFVYGTISLAFPALVVYLSVQ